MGKKIHASKVFAGKSEGKSPVGRPTCRWVRNMENDLNDTGRTDVNWINPAQN
jgi:hypothetical protein